MKVPVFTTGANIRPPHGADMQPGKAILWALHVQGPDDVYAAPSWAAASEAAAYLEHCMTQSRLREEPGLPTISFVVVPWPHSVESHASEVRRWSEVYPGLPAQHPGCNACGSKEREAYDPRFVKHKDWCPCLARNQE